MTSVITVLTNEEKDEIIEEYRKGATLTKAVWKVLLPLCEEGEDYYDVGFGVSEDSGYKLVYKGRIVRSHYEENNELEKVWMEDLGLLEEDNKRKKYETIRSTLCFYRKSFNKVFSSQDIENMSVEELDEWAKEIDKMLVENNITEGTWGWNKYVRPTI